MALDRKPCSHRRIHVSQPENKDIRTLYSYNLLLDSIINSQDREDINKKVALGIICQMYGH